MTPWGIPTLADARLDRLGPHADKIAWPGESMRPRPATLTRRALSDSHERPGVSRCADGGRRRLEGVATSPGSTWQRSRGLGGRRHVDCVATFPWMGWQTSVEYAMPQIFWYSAIARHYFFRI